MGGKEHVEYKQIITDPIQPDEFRKISGDGLAPCTWELEVINHERISWTEHILKNGPKFNFEKYLKDVINKKL